MPGLEQVTESSQVPGAEALGLGWGVGDLELFGS